MSQRVIVRVIAVAFVIACGRSEPAAPPAVEVHGAWVRAADSGLVTAAYLTVVNHTAAPVKYKGASSPLATDVALHETMVMGDMVHMTPLDTVPAIAPGDSLVLAEGAKHLMVSELRRRLSVGDTLPLTLTFADGRTLSARAAVRSP